MFVFSFNKSNGAEFVDQCKTAFDIVLNPVILRRRFVDLQMTSCRNSMPSFYSLLHSKVQIFITSITQLCFSQRKFIDLSKTNNQ